MDLGPSDRPDILYDCEDSSSLGLSALSETFYGQWPRRAVSEFIIALYPVGPIRIVKS